MPKRRFLVGLLVVTMACLSAISVSAYEHNTNFGDDCHGLSEEPTLTTSGGLHPIGQGLTECDTSHWTITTGTQIKEMTGGGWVKIGDSGVQCGSIHPNIQCWALADAPECINQDYRVESTHYAEVGVNSWFDYTGQNGTITGC